MLAAFRRKDDGKPLGVFHFSKQFIFRHIIVRFEYQRFQEIVGIFIESLVSDVDTCQAPTSGHRTSRQDMHNLVVFPHGWITIKEFCIMISVIIIVVAMSDTLRIYKIILTLSKSGNIVSRIEIYRHFGLPVRCFRMSWFSINIDSVQVDFCVKCVGI